MFVKKTLLYKITLNSSPCEDQTTQAEPKSMEKGRLCFANSEHSFRFLGFHFIKLERYLLIGRTPYETNEMNEKGFK